MRQKPAPFGGPAAAAVGPRPGTELPERRIASVSKALAALTYVAGQELPVTAKEISEILHQPMPTTYHMLSTLVSEGALVKGRDRAYRLGPRIGVLSDAYREQGEPTEALLAPLRDLAQTTGETAYLSTWRHGEIVVVATAEGSHAVRVGGLKRGAYGHAHARASGKLLLALSHTSRRERYLDNHELVALTANTIVTRDKLDIDFDRIRSRGYSVEEEEFTLGVCCVAAPVVVSERVVGTFTISCPKERFESTRPELLTSLREAIDVAADAVLAG